MFHEQFKKLSALGAGDFEHLDGKLIDHLVGTQTLLRKWHASDVLQQAGLYHAAYGTAGFNERLVSTEQRSAIASIIGAEAEEIVYLYCACDRNYYWPQFANAKNPEFRNRFTSEVFHLSQMQVEHFCELTVANELEIAIENQAFVDKHGRGLYQLFQTMSNYLSEQAKSEVELLLGGIEDN